MLNIYKRKNRSKFNKGDNYPVENVSWDDVQKFITKLNKINPMNYRLPTEAEWEYACRSGGKNEKYCGGDNIDDLGWYKANSNKSTHPVGTKQANNLGLYDMTGNVWEWIQDYYQYEYYKKSPRENPQGPSSGTINRSGGCWANLPIYSLSTNRANTSNPGKRRSGAGFRLVLPAQ